MTASRVKRLSISSGASLVLARRYLLKDERRHVIETPEQMFQRVAQAVADADLTLDPRADVSATAEDFYRMMSRLEFLPNSPALANGGTALGQLMACFVLPVEDDLDSIFGTLRDAAVVQQSGGGTGFSFSHLRPEDDLVMSTKNVASGPISFMMIYDAMTNVIKQGSMRRGANMGVLRVDHPDILKFITVKRDRAKLINFNVSVALTDSFMHALANNDTFNLINPRTRMIVQTVHARDVWDEMAKAAWESGEPGLIFIDRVNRDNPTPRLGEIEATNPCAEQPLLPYEACCLGSINLPTMLEPRRGQYVLNYRRLGRTIGRAVHFLDNVVEVNRYPLSETERICRANRKIGLGVMGFADMLIRLGIPYDSEEALRQAEDLMRFLHMQATAASEELARRRGPFPNFVGSVYDRLGAPLLRNATVTTIAPTGTISLVADCSSGIEPLFALSYKRRILEGEELLMVHPIFEEVARQRQFYSDDLMETVARRGSVQQLPQVPSDVQRLFVTALDIASGWHVRIQAIFQKHTDNGVSKTVNLPRNATVDDVREIFDLAYRLGCKGITIYRYGSRPAQVLSLSAYCIGCGEDALPGTAAFGQE